MTLRKLIFSIRVELKEPIEAIWSDKQLVEYINETLLYDIATLVNEKRTFSTTVMANTVEVELPVGLLIPMMAAWHGVSRSDIEIGAIVSRHIFSDTVGTPRLAWVVGNRLRLYPIPSRNGILRIYGTVRPLELDIDRPDEVPVFKDVDEIIKLGATYRALRVDNNPLAEQYGLDLDKVKFKYLENKIKTPQKREVKDYWSRFYGERD